MEGEYIIRQSYITNYSFLRYEFHPKVAKGRADPYLQKRKEMEEADEDAVESKKMKIEDDRSEDEK